MGSLGVPAFEGNQAPDGSHLLLWPKGDTVSAMLPFRNKARGASALWSRGWAQKVPRRRCPASGRPGGSGSCPLSATWLLGDFTPVSSHHRRILVKDLGAQGGQLGVLEPRAPSDTHARGRRSCACPAGSLRRRKEQVCKALRTAPSTVQNANMRQQLP